MFYKELDKKYIDAVNHYELELKTNTILPVDIFINLAFLYWEFATEFAFRDENNISDSWSELGGERYPKIIEKGLKHYPNNIELHFWDKYFPYRHYFAEFTKTECERLLDIYGDRDSIVPYFFLYLFDEIKYLEKRDLLLKQCEDLPTAKNLYIKSIIE
jgi:hypothetical protein